MKSMILALMTVCASFAFADSVAVFQATYTTESGSTGQKNVNVNLYDQKDGTILLVADGAESAVEGRPVLAGYAVAQYAFAATLPTANYLCQSVGYKAAKDFSGLGTPLPALVHADLLSYSDNAAELVVSSERQQGYLVSATCVR